MSRLGNLKNLSQLAKAAQAKKSKEVLTVSVEDVVSKPQVRKRFRNLEELAASLKAEGQQTPIIVSPRRPDGKYVIQKGERRWRACKIAGLQTIDIIINDKEQTDLDETAGELIENIQRDDLTPLEIAEALKVFVDAGWKQKQIAERIGKHISFVSTHLSLLKLPKCVRQLYDQEVTADTETLNNLRLLYDLDPEKCEAVCARALVEGFSRKESRDLLNAAKRTKDQLTGQAGAPAAVAQHEQEADQSVQPTNITDGFSPSTDRQQLKDQTQKVSHVQTGAAAEQNSEWRQVRPEELVVTVDVHADETVRRAVLLLDRAAMEPGMIWVQMEHDNAPACVRVTDVELVSVG